MIPKNASTQWKGIACLMIVLHHYLHLTGDYAPGTFYQHPVGYIISAHFGYIFVSLFFFLSGYGLAESETRKPTTLTEFAQRRLTRIYVPFVLTNLLAIGAYAATGRPHWSFQPRFTTH